MTFLIGFINVQILYIINKTRVKDLCTTYNLLRYNNFVQGNNFENIFFKKFSNLLLSKCGKLDVSIFVSKYIKFV